MFAMPVAFSGNLVNSGSPERYVAVSRQKHVKSET